MLTPIRKIMLFKPRFLLIVVLLIGMPILSHALLKVLKVQINRNGPLVATYTHSGVQTWSDEPLSDAYYILQAKRLDDDGEITGLIYIHFSRQHIGVVQRRNGPVNSVKYTASSWVEGLEGKANAWVIAPGNGRSHDENPNGFGS